MSASSEKDFRPGSRTRPAEQERLTLAGGRTWLTWLRCPAGRRLDRWLVRWPGWSPLYWLFGHRMMDGRLGGTAIMLHTVGRVSGLRRPVVLPAFARDGRWLVCATLGGGPRDPQWVANLVATPAVWIHVRRRRVAVTATLTPQQRGEVFDWLVSRHPGLGLYQCEADRYGRTIPVVALTPALPIRPASSSGQLPPNGTR